MKINCKGIFRKRILKLCSKKESQMTNIIQILHGKELNNRAYLKRKKNTLINYVQKRNALI